MNGGSGVPFADRLMFQAWRRGARVGGDWCDGWELGLELESLRGWVDDGTLASIVRRTDMNVHVNNGSKWQ